MMLHAPQSHEEWQAQPYRVIKSSRQHHLQEVTWQSVLRICSSLQQAINQGTHSETREKDVHPEHFINITSKSNSRIQLSNRTSTKSGLIVANSFTLSLSGTLDACVVIDIFALFCLAAVGGLSGGGFGHSDVHHDCHETSILCDP